MHIYAFLFQVEKIIIQDVGLLILYFFVYHNTKLIKVKQGVFYSAPFNYTC